MTAPRKTERSADEVERSEISEGQRRINVIWEVTQSTIALAVTLGTLFVSASLALSGSGMEAAFLLMSNGFFLVIGFYFGRTNHQKIGGPSGGDAGR